MVTTSARRPLANNGHVSQQNNQNNRNEGFINPVRGGGRVTSNFGNRIHPIRGGVRHHDGIDIAAPTGTPVGAARSGRVVFAGDRRDGYGNQVVVDHGNGLQTRYAHLNDINVETGSQLRQGQQLGTVGSTGNSTGPHLHFEIIRNGQVVNPGPILAGTQNAEDAQGVRHASLPSGSAPVSGGGSPSYARNTGGGLPSYQQASYSPGYRQAHHPSIGRGASPGMGSGGGSGIDIERLLQMAEEMGISVEELLYKILSGEIDPREVSRGGGARSGGGMRSGGTRRGSGTGRTAPGNGSAPVRGGGRMDPKNIYQLARQAGFSNDQAVTMTAIAMAESGGNPNAHNPNASTGDNSYGLWQINMLGNMGPQRRQAFGISSNEALFDPQTNARAARQVFESQGFNAWSVYKSGTYRNHLAAARQVAASSSQAA